VVTVVAVLGVDRTTSVVAVFTEVVFILFFLRHFAFAVSALQSASSDIESPPLEDPGFVPPVSVLVACKNEQSVVEGMVGALLALDYPADRLQLIVVNDASTDRTAELLDAIAAAEPRLTCLHRSPDAVGGKSAALNDALPLVTGDVVVVFDADHQPDSRVVRRLVSHFRDPRVAAVQGRCEIRNEGDSPLARLIAIDYMAGYLVNEYGRQSLFELPAYGGANCAVRVSSLQAAGGWNPNTVTEDTDLTVRLLLGGSRIRYDVNAVDREEGVVTLERFWRQRYRWARGHQQVCRDYRRFVWSAPHLSLWQKVELTMFLYVFHLPVVSAVGLVVVGAWSMGLAQPMSSVNTAVFWTLLFLGPLLELGAGVLIAEADRRYVRVMAYFLPLFFISIALCTKAWLDGLAGRPYGWVKTQRSADDADAVAAA
jgi:cellulose synthase/poly-beta-1,6-N-acetylglucosamine synthase-like glycosyltransferase